MVHHVYVSKVDNMLKEPCWCVMCVINNQQISALEHL